MNPYLWAHFADFTKKEFTCKCGRCDGDAMVYDFMAMLQKARKLAGLPFTIMSGFRCHDHNTMVGGVPDSAHMSGLAADIRARNSLERHSILTAIYAAGFQRIGIYKDRGFIHVDTDTRKAQGVTWIR